jgi:hypothetical protein
MRILKLSAALFIALTCMTANGAPVLQLGITNGSYDAVAGDVITASNSFTLNAFGKSTGGNAASLLTNYYVSIAVFAAEGLNPANFGSFSFGGTTYTLIDMVFGNPPAETSAGHDGGDLGPHDLYDTWFTQHAFQFSDSNRTSAVNVENRPAFDPLANPGTDFFYQSFNVDTQGLVAGYNLHFDLFSTKLKRGDVKIASHAPFSHDASTAYSYNTTSRFQASVPEPSTFVVFCLALAGIFLSRKLVWPPAAAVKDRL